MQRFYSVSEVAARFEVTGQTVRNWIAAGQLPAVQPTRGGRYKIPADELLALENKSGLRPEDAATDRPRGRLTKETATSLMGEPVATELARVVAAIVTSVRPASVILFGSRARGDFQASSDFDLAILAVDGVARRRVAMRAYESLAAVADRSVAVDIVVLTPSIMEAERDLIGSIPRAVSREGVFLFGSPAADA